MGSGTAIVRNQDRIRLASLLPAAILRTVRSTGAMLMLRFTFLLLCLLTLPLRANLGDSVAQCVGRYGKPVGFSEANAKLPFGTLAFSATGYTLIIFLLNDKEVGARVSKLDKTAFTDAEMQLIMGADLGGSQWISTPSTDPTCLQWARADKATALYDKAKHILIFTAPEMAAALQTPPAKPAAAK
jgi:hypothetical protein